MIGEPLAREPRLLALVDRLRALSPSARAAILGRCSTREIAALRWAWSEFWARPDHRVAGSTEGTGQLEPPGDYTWWANIGGRSSGKTMSCSGWVNKEAHRLGKGCIFHLLGPTIDDAAETMIEGPTGLLATAPPWMGVKFKPSKAGGIVTWKSGARARLFGAERPRKGRGPQCNRMWLDDPAAFGEHGKNVLDQLLFGFRLLAPDGSQPRGVISSTPIDTEIMRWILDGSKRKTSIVYSRSITDDNRNNLAKSYFDETLAEFEGTELEQQERFGVANFASSGKVFGGIDFLNHRKAGVPEGLIAIAIWIDPALSTSSKACEVGMVVGGLTRAGHCIALEDASDVLSADEWPDLALDLYERWAPHASSIHIGVETNRGGNQNGALLRSAEKIRRLNRGLPGVSVIEIREAFADRSKATRAAPLPRLYIAKQLWHVPGLVKLERQLRDLTEVKRDGTDRADAWVYCVLDLALGLYAVGGEFAQPMGLGVVPVGAMNVGRSVELPRPQIGGAAPFSFGGGQWR